MEIYKQEAKSGEMAFHSCEKEKLSDSFVFTFFYSYVCITFFFLTFKFFELLKDKICYIGMYHII